jgi:type I restriction enzyme M protein
MFGYSHAAITIQDMAANAFHNIAQIETSLWEAADQLRANSNLTATEYSMPVLGVIFLRHATNRYQVALQAIEADQAAGLIPSRVRGLSFRAARRLERR